MNYLKIIYSKIKLKILCIKFLFQDQDNFISVKPELNMINVFKKINKKIVYINRKNNNCK